MERRMLHRNFHTMIYMGVSLALTPLTKTEIAQQNKKQLNIFKVGRMV